MWGVGKAGLGVLQAILPGSNSFTYDLADLFISRNHYYYVSCKLNLLDVEKEWFFDTDTKTLYLHAPGGGLQVVRFVVKRKVMLSMLPILPISHWRGSIFLARPSNFMSPQILQWIIVSSCIQVAPNDVGDHDDPRCC